MAKFSLKVLQCNGLEDKEGLQKKVLGITNAVKASTMDCQVNPWCHVGALLMCFQINLNELIVEMKL